MFSLFCKNVPCVFRNLSHARISVTNNNRHDATLFNHPTTKRRGTTTFIPRNTALKMRAFYASRIPAQLSRTALASISTTRMWCATDGKTEAKNEQKTETTEEVVSIDAYKKLEKELADMKEKLEETKKQALYCAAEAENARRIGREDVDKAKLYGITSFGKDMLEVADTLEKGLEAFGSVSEEELRSNKQLDSIHTGVKLSLKVLAKNMGRHGIEKMNTKPGTKFDPNFHDALVSTPATEQHPSEHISGVLKDGYTIKNRVLRAAQVSVSTD